MGGVGLGDMLVECVCLCAGGDECSVGRGDGGSGLLPSGHGASLCNA